MVYAVSHFKRFSIRRNAFAHNKKRLFFRNHSYLPNLSKESVFSQNPETTTIPFPKESTFIFGAWRIGE